MIRNDFVDGDFPISSRCPVICILDNGEVSVAYNNTELKKILENTKSVKSVFGIWPGKYNTDLFAIDPSRYKIRVPPEENKEIDDAVDVEVVYRSGRFHHLSYKLKDANGERIVESDNPELLNYIKATKRYRNTYT